MGLPAVDWQFSIYLPGETDFLLMCNSIKGCVDIKAAVNEGKLM
jgi:hypothetical protein